MVPSPITVDDSTAILCASNHKKAEEIVMEYLWDFEDVDLCVCLCVSVVCVCVCLCIAAYYAGFS